ncbi:ABC transporter permease subunit [Rhodospirillaceae bacterium KN72]|uniref:ABC transporter permease subunit n=1 Tax=Pacificispira spongiicola TaxID=2729598 RepID=A0A7Y0HDT2_9PROT|nr:ABC transporter permease subunit [Pacificispira spongiicola]NMM44166.1 ABC transporter permease subunit [Pacificispira spongiicola]
MSTATTTSDIGGSPRTRAIAEFWHYFSENKGAVVGLCFVGIVICCAIFAPLIAPYSPEEQFRDYFLVPPVWEDGGSSMFLLGTDAVGRDILSRLIYGARYSLAAGCVIIALTLTSGIGLGLTAGYVRGWFEVLVMRLMDIILSVPSLLLALVLVTVLGPGLFSAIVAIAVTYVPHFVRLTRAQVISEAQRDYVTASRVAGAGTLRLMVIAILPNCMAPLIVQATMSFSTSILDVAALGFLGVGAQPPTPEWGRMLAEAREFITRAWWVVTFPGLAILLTVLAINLMGDGLRDALDPKMKRS